MGGRPNDEIAEFISGWLRRNGVGCAEVRGDGGGVNLLASTGPAGGGMLLAAHMDVVEVEGQPWSGDPWRLRRDGDRLVGRGSADMKGFLACAMRAMADATALELREPLRLAVSTDEEIGCVGVRDLLPAVAALPQRPRACLVGEPTAMRLVTAHKGKLALRATLHGSARHSSEAPLADNAVEHAAELVLALRDRGRELADGRRDRRFAIPHSTISVGPIHGGRALNVVPDHCTVEFEVRNLPGEIRPRCSPRTGRPRSNSWPPTRRWTARPALSATCSACLRAIRSTSARRPGCTRSWASPPPSAGPATSATHTAPTSRSQSSSWTRAPQRWADLLTHLT